VIKITTTWKKRHEFQ